MKLFLAAVNISIPRHIGHVPTLLILFVSLSLFLPTMSINGKSYKRKFSMDFTSVYGSIEWVVMPAEQNNLITWLKLQAWNNKEI